MRGSISRLVLAAGWLAAAGLGPAAFAQARATCNGLAATIVATAPGVINGTPGDDVIVGTAGDDRIFGFGGNDTICGGGGNDQITGGQGNDTLLGEGGNDTFFWFPGDGSDRIEGASGTDSLVATGANIGESIGMSGSGGRLRLTRDVANIALDAGGVERVVFAARGGSDLITVASLAGTGVAQVTLELEGAENSGTGDGAADSIFVFGSAGDDQITAKGSGGQVDIAGAGAAIQIRHADGALDTLSIYGVEGNDRINAEAVAAGAIKLIVDGGPGQDTIRGSAGSDALVGGADDDTLEWPLGTAADLLGGDEGTDTLVVIGSNAADRVAVSAAGLDTEVVNYADGTTTTASVERVVVQARGGADQVWVSLAQSAALQSVLVDLRAAGSTGGDLSADAVTVTGTTGVDGLAISGGAGSATVAGLAPRVDIVGAESARDTLTVSGGAGDDTLDAAGLAADSVRLTLRGGQGLDTVTGSAGNDTIAWSPGDGSDNIEGGPGEDTLQISAANIAEKLAFGANGAKLRFTRDIGSVALEAGGVERVTLAALGGADTITVGDLSGTAVRQMAIDLAAAGGGGDGAADTIAIAVPPGSSVSNSVGAGTWTLYWAPVRIAVSGVEAGADRVVLQTLPGGAPAAIAQVRLGGAAGAGADVAVQNRGAADEKR